MALRADLPGLGCWTLLQQLAAEDLGPRELWAGCLAQNATPIVFQDEWSGLAAAGFSPRGRWLVGLRGQGERSTEVLRWRWARGRWRAISTRHLPEVVLLWLWTEGEVEVFRAGLILSRGGENGFSPPNYS